MIPRNSILVPSLFNSFTQLFSQAAEGLQELIKKAPDYELYATDTGWTLHLDAVGIEKEDISLKVEDGSLVITAEGDHFPISRTFTIGEDVDIENIQASLNNGVLELTLPKTNPTKNITID